MFFITNRAPNEGIKSEVGRTFTFDLDNSGSLNDVYYCESGEGGKHTEIGSEALLQRVRTSGCSQILLYLHGFNNLPDVVLERAAQLQAYCDAAKANEVLVLPLIWPCDNDRGVVKDYWDDQKSADHSGAYFARALQKFVDWRNDPKNELEAKPCLMRINLLAHSMGNRVLRQTLAEWERNDLPSGVPLLMRNTFMIAADVVNETVHEDQPGALISHASRNVVVYYASDDLALRASKAANLRNKVASRRLGHTGPENMDRTPRNVYRVDCDDLNTRYDKPTGHMYFLDNGDGETPGKVFAHMMQCMLKGRVFPENPDQRSFILR